MRLILLSAALIALCACSTATHATQDSAPGDARWPVCETVVGDRGQTPIDLVWAVDSSSSMQEGELGRVAHQLERLAERLQDGGLDARYVLVGAPDLCISPPLGGADCRDSSNFMHIKSYVGGRDLPERLIQLYPNYMNFLRRGAKRTLIMVSDDDPQGINASQFDRQLRGRLGFSDDYIVYSIVAFSPNEDFPSPGGCRGGTAPGYTYLELSKQTGGEHFSICEPNWTKTADGLSRAILSDVHPPCSYNVPQADRAVQEGSVGFFERAIDPEVFQVRAKIGGKWRELTNIGNALKCADQQAFWINNDSKTIEMCSAACMPLEVQQLQLLFGCADPLE